MTDIANDLKKVKLESSEETKIINSSKLFKPYQILSQFSSPTSNKDLFDINLSMDYVTVSIGSQYIIYSLKNFNILFKSQIFKNKIAQLKTDMSGYVYVLLADGTFIVCFRNKIIGSYKQENELTHKIIKFDILNDFVVFITNKNHVLVCKKFKQEFSTATESNVPDNETVVDDFRIVIQDHGNFFLADYDYNNKFLGFEHIPTYLNKILAVFENGYHIINLRTCKLIHTNLIPSGIKVFNNVPILDHMVICHKTTNHIEFINVKKDTVTKKMNLNLDGNITNMCIPADYNNLLLITTDKGSIIIYDLVMKKIQQELMAQHDNIISFRYLSTKNGFITQGNDNAIKMFIFEDNNVVTNQSHENDSTLTVHARLYKSLQGHKEPPSLVRFKDSEGHFIVSASEDSLWEFSTRKLTQSTRFTNKNNKVKIPGVLNSQNTSYLGGVPKSMSLNQQSKWDNNLLINFENSGVVKIYNTERHTLQDFLKNDKSNVCVSSISPCGNFGIVGMINGTLEVYNLQSMTFKKRFKGLHKMQIVGCEIDNMNQFLYSCSLDGVIGKWDYYGNKIQQSLKLDDDINILKFEYCHLNDLIAVVTDDDFRVLIIDTNSMKVIRSLEGHFNKVNNLKFYNNGKYLITTSLDSTLRIWDISTGFCIDGFIVDNSELITSFDVSENDQFLITTHLNLNGICLWLNKSIFNISNDANSFISLRDMQYEEFVRINLPNGNQDNNKHNQTKLKQRKELDSDFIINRFYETKEQIAPELVTLSTKGNLGLQNMQKLLNIETLRKRSKPKEGVLKPNEQKKESFFIQLKKDLDADVKERQGIVSKSDDKSDDVEEDITMSNAPKLKEYNTTFEKLLLGKDNEELFLSHLKSISISQVNLDIQLMSNPQHIQKLLVKVSKGIESNKDFEIWNGIVNVIFKYHYDVINKNLELFDEALNDLNKLISSKENNLYDLFYYNDCVVKFLLS
ncbi:hypothetical protein ACO0OL_001373 [Hanseniaspora opuntiae]